MNPEDFRETSAGRVLRTPAGYWAFVPHPLPPALHWSDALITALAEAERALGELAGLGYSLPNPHLLIRPFIRREAVFSSRIEGTRASLSDLLTYESVQLSLFELPDDVREVHNYVRALEYGLERLAELPLSLRLMREIHAILLEGVRGQEQTPGEFRRSQNWIGPPGAALQEATFVPPPLAEMGEALDALEKFLHDPPQLPPLIRLGLFHYQFEAIHPFLDGNGRIGRLLNTLLLCAWGLLPTPLLYLSPYFEARRQQYYDLLLQVSQRGDWEAWLTFFLRGVVTQGRDAVQRIRSLERLHARYREQLQSASTAARLLQVVDLLFERPVLQTRQVETALGINFSTAQRYLDRLLQEGILNEITGRARNRLYRADEILKILDQPSPQDLPQ
ncbi:MAG: Fic family protein [Chloroflexi bacterium]|nr:Fic family protein [Chloroflexota bacterium]